MKIFESILREKNRKLTRAQQRILRYIFDNFDEAVFLNASKVAKKADVSESSVIRLAQTLEFDGYPAMQRELQRHYYYRLSTVNRLVETEKVMRDDQDVFVKVWKNIDKFREDAALFTWIYRIATNESLNFLNKKKRRFMLPIRDISKALELSSTQ